ncbi:MAG: hypothetical protein OES26_20735 [Gammaproteobacteria bacterium]|nr:hypothetical protein [Gammaproteobacteria bacterium]
MTRWDRSPTLLLQGDGQNRVLWHALGSLSNHSVGIPGYRARESGPGFGET